MPRNLVDLTAPQFIYAVCCAENRVEEFIPSSGHCHLCGGKLFVFNDKHPVLYNKRIEKSWLAEDLARDKDSKDVCPACAWMYGTRRTIFQKGVEKPSKEDKQLVAALSFSAAGKYCVKNGDDIQVLIDFFVHPPEPPFVSVAWIKIKQVSSRKVPFNARISWQRNPYFLLVDGTMTWIYPGRLEEAIDEYLKWYTNFSKQRPRKPMVNTPERWLADDLAKRILKKIKNEEDRIKKEEKARTRESKKPKKSGKKNNSE